MAKYADHLPLYRQSQIFAREGLHIDRSTLAHWVGFAAVELEPLHAGLVQILKASTKLFADETRCPVLDPGRGRTKTGYLWTIARDDRPWGGTDHRAIAYLLGIYVNPDLGAAAFDHGLAPDRADDRGTYKEACRRAEAAPLIERLRQ